MKLFNDRIDELIINVLYAPSMTCIHEGVCGGGGEKTHALRPLSHSVCMTKIGRAITRGRTLSAWQQPYIKVYFIQLV